MSSAGNMQERGQKKMKGKAVVIRGGAFFNTRVGPQILGTLVP